MPTLGKSERSLALHKAGKAARGSRRERASADTIGLPHTTFGAVARRMARYRKDVRRFAVRPHMVLNGLRHESDCVCYDCLWGENAQLREMALSGRLRTIQEYEPRELRFPRSPSAMPGVRGGD